MLPAREWHGGTSEEYQTQHFGFGSQTLSIALRGAVERSIVDNVRGMESSLAESLALTGADKIELSRACDKLISLYLQRAAPAMLRLYEELDKLLEIPDSIVLPDDEEKAVPATEEELERLRADVAAAEKRVHRAALMETLLKVEEKELKSVEKYTDLSRQTIDSLDGFLKNMDKTEAVNRLDTETSESCKVVPRTKEKTLWDFISDGI